MASKRVGRRRQLPTTERKIHFFRANAGLAPGGKLVPVDFSKLFDVVAGKRYASGERYWELADGNAVCAWPDDGRAHPAARLATVRRQGLPLLEDAGALSDLPIPASAGLYEASHVMCFPKNIVGVEFNFYGPRPSRLPRYLQTVVGAGCPTFTLDPLLREDVSAQLRQLKRIRKLDLKVRASYTERVQQANQTLGRALAACREVGDSDVVQIVLQPAPHERGWLANKALTAVRALARRSDLRENALTFQVRGVQEDSPIETIDVLRDELIATKQVVLVDSRSRAVNDDSAYRAIEEAYSELKQQLENASSVSG